MRKKRIVAMLLAGGQGSRLGALTVHMAKPAVPFGGKYRIIDFPLSNCVHSDIDTVGVLTQYEPMALNAYIGNGQAWDLDRNYGGVFVLPPYVKEGEQGAWYSNTANAIYQNIAFLDQYNPDNVLILSGDHIYKMDYAAMLKYHIKKNADATIAVQPVPIEEASRFGIMNTDDAERVVRFEEKPKKPVSNKASMGIYIFKWDVLRRYLIKDNANENSVHDFGKNIIPALIEDGFGLFAYEFTGYWKDVGTVASLWEANMDLLNDPPSLNLYDKDWRIYSLNPIMPPHYVDAAAKVKNSLVSEGSYVAGDVDHSVLFFGTTVGKNTVVRDSIIMPGAVVGDNAVIRKAIIGENTVVGDNCIIGDELREDDAPVDNRLTGDITLIGNDVNVPANTRIPRGTLVTPLRLKKLLNGKES